MHLNNYEAILRMQKSLSRNIWSCVTILEISTSIKGSRLGKSFIFLMKFLKKDDAVTVQKS